jgi:hypothetical protein
VVAFTLLHQFLPSLPTDVVALALGVAMAYSAAATIFIQELFRGAIRALDMLEGKAAEALGITAVTAFPATAQPEAATPLPLRSSQPMSGVAVAPGSARVHSVPLHEPGYQLPHEEVALAPQAASLQTAGPTSTPSMVPMPSIPSMPSVPPKASTPSIPAILAVQAALGLPAGAGVCAGGAGHDVYARFDHEAYLDRRRPIEEEPTRPVRFGPDDGATVMVLPENSMYVPRLAPQPRHALTPWAPHAVRAAEHEPLHPLPHLAPNPARQFMSQPPMTATPRRLAPLAEASPSPALYAPWAVVPPIADPTAKTELSTMVAREVALAFQPVRRPNWWPRRRRVQPLLADGR